jgi:hypothetical protein
MQDATAAGRAGAPRTGRGAWPLAVRSHALWWLALLALLLPAYGYLLVSDRGAIGRDFGMLFLDVLCQQRAALLDGRILLWDPSQLGGTAFWPLPNEAPLYPPLMACLLLRGVLPGLNLCLFLHVLWGALGTYALVHRLGGRRLAALVGGVLWAYSYFTRHTATILPLEMLASAWIPWALYALARMLTEASWPRALGWAALAAVAYAGVPWLGGFIQFLPGLVVIGTVVLFAALRNPSRERWARAVLGLPLVVALMALLAAGKLVPMAEWISLTDRSGGITEQFALGGSLLPNELLQFSLNEGITPWVLLLCGLLLGALRRDSWCVPFAAAVAALLLIASGPLYKLLYHVMPGFSYVREPRRVWMLMPAVLPAAAGLGLAHLQDVVQGRLKLAGARAAAAGVAVLALAGTDMIGYGRYQPPGLHSLSLRLQNNALHQDLARRAQVEPRFRVVDIAKARSRVKQTSELYRSALGLESLEGVLGNVSIVAWDIDYLNLSRTAKAKILGLMNGRYVTSMAPISQPGLELVAEFPPDPERVVKGSDGPFLYRNELALPRASLLDHALLLLGGAPLQRQALLLSDAWDPRRMLLVEAHEGALDGLADSVLRRLDGVVLGANASEASEQRLRDAGVACFRLTAATGAALRPWLAQVTAAGTPLQPVDDPPREWNGVSVRLPDRAGGRWLLLAETCAIYPGWTARVDGEPAPLLVADAAATAIPLPEVAGNVTLDYVPPGLVPGLLGTAVGVLLVLLLLWRARRYAA